MKLGSTYNTRSLYEINSNLCGDIWRSDRLDNVSDEDIAILKENNIRQIIDLRTAKERKLKLNTDPFFTYKQIPFDLSSWNTGKTERMSIGEIYEILPYEYMDYVSQYDAIRGIVDEIMNNQYGTVIMCSHGKDRTGVVIAVLLMLMQIDEKTIVDDYMLSGLNLRKRPNVPKDKFAWLDAKEKVIKRFINQFKEKYYNAEKYFLNMGYSNQQIEQLVSRLSQ